MYTPFPDPHSHRILIDDLAQDSIRDRLSSVWTNPLSLDPSRQSSKVTRDVANRLASVSKALESDGLDRERVSSFLTRCLFSMFAEDVGLLPPRSFLDLLSSVRDRPAQFVPLLSELWQAMDKGEFSTAIRAHLPLFNGKLFKSPEVLPLNRDQIDLLIGAARSNWKEVEPAIFGTLLERALDPEERHALGGHYTPRAYVERLVIHTVVEPIRKDWKEAQSTALILAKNAKPREAKSAIVSFLKTLTSIRVLDPACGSGNFLYVTLEHLKRIEGEVLNFLGDLGVDTNSDHKIASMSVDPHQFLGIEINPRAAAVAELVLWIGYLQWHFRTRGPNPPRPVLKDYSNIECRDALITYDAIESVPASRLFQLKVSKKRARKSSQKSLERTTKSYSRPRQAAWMDADFIVGNPPFLGSKRMREALGDGYVDALQLAWPEVPEATDIVMRWWHKAACLVRKRQIRRFGFITTNSIRQVYVRRAIEPHLEGRSRLSIVFAVPDHPWVDSSDGSAVRIAMTVAEHGKREGRLCTVVREREESTDENEDLVESMRTRIGDINSNLTVGSDITRARELRSNQGL
jgi:hypothetical protein